MERACSTTFASLGPDEDKSAVLSSGSLGGQAWYRNLSNAREALCQAGDSQTLETFQNLACTSSFRVWKPTGDRERAEKVEELFEFVLAFPRLPCPVMVDRAKCDEFCGE
ncbi:hypothetical protein R1flu_015713 [Riccia fluitans]|uniref:Uncharacterized protein n=1 Tax=Riccia fluitans TaxID=41844 RepID=A0ABD1YNL8_9MARC